MDNRSSAFFKEATKKLEAAKEELFKPEEDMVSYSVCKNSQFAIENFLKGYLINHEVEIEMDETIQSLYEKCLQVNEDFKQIELKSMGCRTHQIDSRYCSEIESVSACFDAADNLDTYLKKIKLI